MNKKRDKFTIKAAFCSECESVVKDHKKNTIPICQDCEKHLLKKYN